MILSDFLKAVGQLGDRRFLRVMGFGLLLSLALLVGIYAAALAVIDLFVPGSFAIPYVGTVTSIGHLLSIGSLLLMLAMSVFLMVPVAAAFTAFFLEDVVQAVEARSYPGLPPAAAAGIAGMLIDTLNFLGVLVVVNVLSLAMWAFAGPFVPVLFWAINGYLLGREYFTMVASRRIGRRGARNLRRAHWAEVWLAGVLMAAPLSLPLVSLVIPVLGVATFTHMFHRLAPGAQVRSQTD